MKTLYLGSAISILFMFGLSSCICYNSTPNVVYPFPVDPVTHRSTSPFDSVWSKAIDVFVENGYSIKAIDKESGVLISSPTSLMNVFTYEKRDGSLANQTAHVVISRRSLGELYELNAEIFIRIKKADAFTEVEVTMANLQALYRTTGTESTPSRTYYGESYSTGNLEKEIAEKIK